MAFWPPLSRRESKFVTKNPEDISNTFWKNLNFSEILIFISILQKLDIFKISVWKLSIKKKMKTKIGTFDNVFQRC